jgi:hypothetical protein
MSNPDRLMREAQEHAETLIEDRGRTNALAWAQHCATRANDGLWMRVVEAIKAYGQCDGCGAWKLDCDYTTAPGGLETFACAACRNQDDDEAADHGDWQFHQERDR